MKATLDEQRSALAVARGYEILAQPDLAESAYAEILKRRPTDPVALTRLAALLVRYDENRRAEPVLRLLVGPQVGLPEEAVPENSAAGSPWSSRPPSGKRTAWTRRLRLLDLNKPRGEDAADARTRALVLGRRGQPLSGLRHPACFSRRSAVGSTPRRAATAGVREILAEAIRKDPVNAGTVAAMIESLYRDKRRAEAIEWIDRLEKLEPRSARVAEFRRRWAQ